MNRTCGIGPRVQWLLSRRIYCAVLRNDGSHGKELWDEAACTGQGSPLGTLAFFSFSLRTARGRSPCTRAVLKTKKEIRWPPVHSNLRRAPAGE